MAKRKEREKANAKKEKKLIDNEFKSFRTSMLCAWLASNYVFIFIIQTVITDDQLYLKFLILVMLYFMGVRFIGSIGFLISRWSWLGYRKWLKSGEDQANKRSARNHKGAARHTGGRNARPSRRGGGGGGRGTRPSGRGAAGHASSAKAQGYGGMGYTPPTGSENVCRNCAAPLFADRCTDVC